MNGNHYLIHCKIVGTGTTSFRGWRKPVAGDVGRLHEALPTLILIGRCWTKLRQLKECYQVQTKKLCNHYSKVLYLFVTIDDCYQTSA